MPSPKIIPIRFTEDTLSRLDKTSLRLGTNRSALVRFLTDRFLAAMEAKGADYRPIDFDEILHSLDGRRAALHESDQPSTTPIQKKPVKFEPGPKRQPKKKS